MFVAKVLKNIKCPNELGHQWEPAETPNENLAAEMSLTGCTRIFLHYGRG